MSSPLPEDSFQPSLSHLVEETSRMLRTRTHKKVAGKKNDEPSFSHCINLIAKMLRETADKKALHPARIDTRPRNRS